MLGFMVMLRFMVMLGFMVMLRFMVMLGFMVMLRFLVMLWFMVMLWFLVMLWEQSPLQIKGTKHFITECKKGFLQIGCKCYSFKEWELHFEKIGRAEYYTDKQIKEYKLYIDLAISLSKL